MVTIQQRSWKSLLYASLLLLIVCSNILLYYSPLSTVLPEDTTWVVFGSLFDLAIIVPLLVLMLTHKKGFTAKRIVTWVVAGILFARLLIPANHFEPFRFIPLLAIGIEAIVVLAELWLLFMLFYHLPKILKHVKQSKVSPLFSFPQEVEKRVRSFPIIKILSAELTMFYYAFTVWKKPVPEGPNYFSLHKKTSVTAFYIMLIHTIILESLGVHWWLHEKFFILSIVLLVINIYSVIYFIGDIQAIRHNPVHVTRDKIYLSLGLSKRMVIPFEKIKAVKWGDEASEYVKNKNTFEFIARDFEDVKPHCLIELSEPLEATLLLGFTRKYSKVAIRLDEPDRFRSLLNNQ